ncbi:DMT family transporter [Paenibacillus silviterrae]|uniref:DMT family transporter n=1 Tax=Paenibacillus silviterrae TaxID=3242194 RepID=UPI002543F546|nr:DMT family transporter [Paenibacillus chinjuensis]
MFVTSLVLVLCSGLVHAVWNLFAKQSTDKPVFLWLIYAPSTVVLLPKLIMELAEARLSYTEWLMIGLSLLMQCIYSALLAVTYQFGDLSQVYPIMRGTPTLLIPLMGVIFLGEALPLWGWCGIGIMLIGFLVMNGHLSTALFHSASRKPVVLALGVGLCISIYTLVDKVNLQYLSPLALLEVTNIGFLLGLTPAVVHLDRVKQVVRNHLRILLIGFFLAPGSYLLFLFAAQTVNVSTIAPLREIGIVFGTLLGIVVLKESQGLRRIIASVAIVTGIIIIASSNH